MSLGGRFAAASSAVALATSSAAFIAVGVTYNATQERQLDAVLLTEAEADAAEAAYSEDALAGHPPVLRRGDLGPITKFGAIYDAAGRSIVWTPNLEQGRPAWERMDHSLGVPFDLWWNNLHLRAVLVDVHGHPGQALWLATPRTDIDGDARALARRMVLAAFLATVASAVATSWVSRVLTRDHERIAAVARAVAAGDLSARVASTSSDTEMVQLGRDIDEMISRLAILVETQQRFIASASHELRSPLTTLLGELSLALRAQRDAAAYRSAIEESLHAARRLKALAEDLLALARAGASQLPRERVELADVVRATVASLRATAEEVGVTLETECDGAAIEGHAGDLERLVRNLTENAVRHSGRGGHVRITTRAGSTETTLTVADDGPGVPEDAREKIFEPFFRLTSQRNGHAGTGLGLAIGRSIARAHGGDLWVDDASPGTPGARFVVRLPASQTGA